ncbi:patatin-like phospholipase family protein [Nocardia testacea]|uniref:patatin-like phospholipase family protein n=1 Tax=Nocardia testacea TaxID=248551 RepID=UPI003C30AB7F
MARRPRLDVGDFWNPDHPVLNILRQRRESGSTPGNRRDDAKVALTVAGGGMRGAVSAAMCTQLDDSGFKNAFDVVYGCSSGAINAAYFISQPAGTCWYPLSIYYEELAANRFIRYTRPLFGGSLIDLEYVFEEVLASRKPLNYDSVVRSPLDLVVLTTDLAAREVFAAHDFSTGTELKAFLRAGARPPLVVKGESEIDGRRLVDGALLAPSQFRLAIADGCTHILSLGTRRMQVSRPHIPFAVRAYARCLEGVRRGLGSAYLAALRQRRRDREELARHRFGTDGAGPHVLGLAPLPWMSTVRFHDTDPSRILHSIRDAYSVSYCATEGIGVDHLRNGSVRPLTRFAIAGHGGLEPPARAAEPEPAAGTDMAVSAP